MKSNDIGIRSVNNPNVAIILVNYNGSEDTIECLNSLGKLTYSNYTIVVVDNNSNSIEKNKLIHYFSEGMEKKDIQSGSVIQLLHSSQKPILLDTQINLYSEVKYFVVWNDENSGFSGANNIAIKFLMNHSFDFFLLLNNDTIVENNLIEPLVNVHNNSAFPKVGLVGCAINYYDDKIKRWFSKGVFHWYKEGVHITEQCNSVQRSEFITGCTMLISREIIEKVGYLPESYFLYGEDSHYSMKVEKTGFYNYVVPSVLVYHKIGKTTGGNFSLITYYYGNRNRLLFHYLNYSKLDFIFYFIVNMTFRIGRLIQFTFTGKFHLIKVMIKGVYDFFRMKKVE